MEAVHTTCNKIELSVVTPFPPYKLPYGLLLHNHFKLIEFIYYLRTNQLLLKVYAFAKSLMNMVVLCCNVLIWSESDHFDSMEGFVT